MSLYDEISELKSTVIDLNSRLGDIEKGTQKGADGTVKRVAKERMQGEREDRAETMRMKNFARGKRTGAHPTNPERAEEMQRQYNELRAPHPTPRPEAVNVAAGEVSGTPIKFYVWKEGVMGTLEILSKGSFTPLP